MALCVEVMKANKALRKAPAKEVIAAVKAAHNVEPKAITVYQARQRLGASKKTHKVTKTVTNGAVSSKSNYDELYTLRAENAKLKKVLAIFI